MHSCCDARAYQCELTCFAAQNRELQIMRLVKHPNVVDLKAFFYSNGDKVRVSPPSRSRREQDENGFN